MSPMRKGWRLAELHARSHPKVPWVPLHYLRVPVKSPCHYFRRMMELLVTTKMAKVYLLPMASLEVLSRPRRLGPTSE